MVVSQLRLQRLGVFHEVGVNSGGVWGYKNVASVLTISVQTYVLATESQVGKVVLYRSQCIMDLPLAQRHCLLPSQSQWRTRTQTSCCVARR